VLEGLEKYVEVATGTLPTDILIEENGVQFSVPVLEGQKTGWFYDHRMNRTRMCAYIKQQRVLDMFSYGGAWGIQAAVAGAKEVLCVDSSAKALEYVHQNAALNNMAEKVQSLKQDAFDAFKSLKHEQQKFDVVILDPPAFIKRKKDQKEGELAYRRLNQMAMQVLNKNGILISASCSLHLQRATFLDLIRIASQQAKHHLHILEQGHQSPDHPIHPAIPETEYIKTLICHVF
jgi:23S rRNA (cytosine1962-C5)-methyltransferase